MKVVLDMGMNAALSMNPKEIDEFEENLAKTTAAALVLDPALYSPQLSKKITEIEKDLKSMEVEYVKIALFSAQGYSPKEICAQTGLKIDYLSVVLKSKEYQAAVELLTRQVKYYAKAVLVTFVPRALNNLYSLMESANEKIKLAATKEVLDRIGIVDMSEFFLSADKKTLSENVAGLSDAQLKAIIEGDGEIG
jgi:DNA-binding MarR family transcriptional regulator